jgi:hypothetical protein
MSEINFQKFMTFLEYKISLKISKEDNQKLLIEVQTIQCNGQNKEKTQRQTMFTKHSTEN